MADPLHTLYVDEIREVSFVPAGDNPPACVLLMKRRPPSPSTGATMPDTAPPDDVVKNHPEFLKMMAEVEAIKKRDAIREIADTFCKGNNLAADLAADIYEIRKASPDAAKKIEAELARLSIVAKTAEALTKRQGDAGKVNSGNAELEALIAKHRATGKTQAAATLAAYAERPDLYTDSTTGGN
jgi:hypothetical protein